MQRHAFGCQRIDHILPRPQTGGDGNESAYSHGQSRGLRRVSSVKADLGRLPVTHIPPAMDEGSLSKPSLWHGRIRQRSGAQQGNW